MIPQEELAEYRADYAKKKKSAEAARRYRAKPGQFEARQKYNAAYQLKHPPKKHAEMSESELFASRARSREYMRMKLADPEGKIAHRDMSRRNRCQPGSKEKTAKYDLASRLATDPILERRQNMLTAARRRAKLKGVPFSITLDDIQIGAACPILGVAFDLSKSPSIARGRLGPADNSPTLDRVIPELGYVSGNVMVISHRANRFKSDATPDELRRVCEFVSSAFRERQCPK